MLDDVTELRTFVRIVAAGSLSAAGREMALALSVVSKRLASLSARPISRLAADRLPAAAIRTKVRSSVMSSSMLPSYFPIGGE